MNGVCTNIIHLNLKKLQYFGGNYDTFIRTRLEQLENQSKRYQWEQDQIAHMKVNFSNFGINTKDLQRKFEKIFEIFENFQLKFFLNF